MLGESYEVLFEDDYTNGYPQLRYHKGVPSKCPSCGVWSHHTIQRKERRARAKCPLCDIVFDATQYQNRAVRRLTNCLKNYSRRF